MHILLVNDDGFDAAGIQQLYLSLKDTYDISIVAPATQQSAKSHSVTYFFRKKLAHRIPLDGVLAAWSIEGTPADCVYYALHGLLEDKPDLVISGINKGPNLSTDCLYSGTVGAAQEGRIYGVPSMAVSLCSNSATNFKDASLIVKDLIPAFMEDDNRHQYVLNVNIPYLPYEEIKGIKATRFDGMREYSKPIVIREIDAYNAYLSVEEAEIKVIGSNHTLEEDVTAIENGYVSLTPLHMDWTDYEMLELIKTWSIHSNDE